MWWIKSPEIQTNYLVERVIFGGIWVFVLPNFGLGLFKCDNNINVKNKKLNGLHCKKWQLISTQKWQKNILYRLHYVTQTPNYSVLNVPKLAQAGIKIAGVTFGLGSSDTL